MQSNLTPQEWAWLLDRANPVEFGWIGIDQAHRVGYFSTYGQAYMPKKILTSYEKYIELAELINNLPEIGSSALYIKAKGSFRSWHYLSRRGLVGYDYWDIHRKEADRLSRYDLITIPSTPTSYESIAGLKAFEDIIPRFRLDFRRDIPFKDLQENEY